MFKVEMGTEIKDRGANEILRQIESVGSGSSITVGFHAPDIYKTPKYNPPLRSHGSLGEYARGQEFGTLTSPARPFLGPTLVQRANHYAKQSADQLRKMYSSKGTHGLLAILNRQGKQAVKWTQQSIRAVKLPKLERRYASRKRKAGYTSKPLIASGFMLNAVSYRVKVSQSKNLRLTRMMKKLDNQLRRMKV